jgi:predicted nucleic acid-binding protein
VYWDACAWLGLINGEQDRHASCKYTMEQAEKHDVEIVTSAFTLAEVFKRKCAEATSGIRPTSDTKFEDYLTKEHVVLVAVDRDVATYARTLLRNFPELKKPQDAIHLATAALNNVDEFHTYDGENLLPLDGKVIRADRQSLTICTPMAPPPDTSGPLFEKQEGQERWTQLPATGEQA